MLRGPVEFRLAAVVAVDHGARGSAASAQAGHLEGVDDQFGAQVVGDGPADDAAGVGVQDDGAVDPALLGAVLGGVFPKLWTPI